MNSHKLMEENRELKKEREENLNSIQQLTEELDKLRFFERKAQNLEEEVVEKTKKYNETSKKCQKLEDLDFCKFHDLMQKYLLLEKQHVSLKEEMSKMTSKYEKSLHKIDSQKNLIQELKKVFFSIFSSHFSF